MADTDRDILPTSTVEKINGTEFPHLEWQNGVGKTPINQQNLNAIGNDKLALAIVNALNSTNLPNLLGQRIVLNENQEKAQSSTWTDGKIDSFGAEAVSEGENWLDNLRKTLSDITNKEVYTNLLLGNSLVAEPDVSDSPIDSTGSEEAGGEVGGYIQNSIYKDWTTNARYPFTILDGKFYIQKIWFDIPKKGGSGWDGGRYKREIEINWSNYLPIGILSYHTKSSHLLSSCMAISGGTSVTSGKLTSHRKLHMVFRTERTKLDKVSKNWVIVIGVRYDSIKFMNFISLRNNDNTDWALESNNTRLFYFSPDYTGKNISGNMLPTWEQLCKENSDFINDGEKVYYLCDGKKYKVICQKDGQTEFKEVKITDRVMKNAKAYDNSFDEYKDTMAVYRATYVSEI